MNEIVAESSKFTKGNKKVKISSSRNFDVNRQMDSEMVSLKSIELLKRNNSSQKNVLDSSDDTTASQTSRRTSVELTEFRGLNRNEDSLPREFKEKLDELRSKFESKVEALSSKYSQEVKKNMANTLNSLSSQECEGSHGGTAPKNFNEKNFKYQESLLNTLFERNENIKTLYNMGIAGMVILFVNFTLFEFNRSGTLFDYQTIAQSFNKPDMVFNIWIRLFLANMLVIPFTKWVHLSRPPSALWVSLYIFGQLMNYYYAYQATVTNELGFASAMIVLCEATRMSLKTHSYLRNKLLYGSDIWKKYQTLERISSDKSNTDEPQPYIPPIKFHSLSEEIQKYLYFHFAPTLLYRDKYIRGPKTSYKKVIFHFFNCFLCIYYGFILYKTLIIIPFGNTGKNPGTALEFCLSIFSSVLPGITCLLMLFFGLLHSWFCAFAELLRFPDRLFYEDWWTSLEFGTYYRKWNVVVHEWLYHYVYVDLRRFTNNKVSKLTAQLSTFLLSAVVHEVILAGAMGFFYPILFVIFTGPGILLIRSTRSLKNRSFNVVFWALLFIGTGLILALYSREYYARKDGNVDAEAWGYWYYLAPRGLLVYLEKSSN